MNEVLKRGVLSFYEHARVDLFSQNLGDNITIEVV
jgi:hypothetical protein